MNKTSEADLEELWDNLLSRRKSSIRKAFSQLTPQEQQAILSHLHRMSEEAGWHPEQRLSAKAALKALGIPPSTPSESL